ncbi:MAG: phosphatase PAP2 family protein [Prevotella sp.]|nr:phosphatase PAP2 family protein [Prevotella sp.]
MDWAYLIELDKQLLLTLNGSDSLFLDGLVKTLTAIPTWIPLYVALLYVVVKNNDSLQKVLLIVGCALLCVFLAGSLNDMLVKPSVARWRPTRDSEIGMMVDLVNGYRGGHYGFFSSHAANTFSLAVFFSLLIRSRLLTVALVAWSLLNCWTRLYLGVHFPGDILCGLLWGGVVGTAMWYVHHRISRRMASTGNYISSQYTATGYQITDVDAVVCVLLFTLVYAILRACCFLYV